MSGEAERALGRVAEAVAQQLDLLLDGLRRPGLDQTQARRQAFDMLLKALSAEAGKLVDADELGEETRTALSDLVEKAAVFEAGSLDVRSQLIELSADWSCPSCGADVAKAAAVSGVRAETYKVELICGGCGQASPLTPAGRKVLNRGFGKLMTPTWNPRANGFQWNES